MNVTAQAGDTLFQASSPLLLEPQPASSLPCPSAEKQSLRAALRAQRMAIPRLERRKAARSVARRVQQVPQLRKARRVAIYLSMGSELSTAALIAALIAQGKTVFAPVLLRGGMSFRVLGRGRLQRHHKGMLQARLGLALRASAMDVVILPLLGFDAKGHRLGQGGGYYDRALSRCTFRPYRLGLAYAQQQLACLPAEPWDQALDAVLTEQGLHYFSRPLVG
jgi:5-formyltetrahydrofolate cyclo-ligase